MECLERIGKIRGYHLYLRNGFERLDEDMNFSIEESEDGCVPMYYAIDVE